MKGKIRNIYPGGNTPDGFYSYYNYILPQREAEKIFCIKGGPGVGKSTVMKAVGKHFLDMGEDVDFLWCSSDPDSLDGILLKGRHVAIVDGTSPHIVDPKNPGAVDEIVNLGEYWDETALRKNREGIIKSNEIIGELFEHAYGYLRCAREKYRFMTEILDKIIPYEEIREYRDQLHLKLDGISIIRRAESKARKDNVLGKTVYPGKCKKAFAGAITPKGIRNDLGSVISGIEKVIMLEAPVGFRTEKLLASVSERLTDIGFDIEEYYCPMFPEERLEHIVCPDANVAIVTSNRYHNIESRDVDGKAIRLVIGKDIKANSSEMLFSTLDYLQKTGHGELLNAVEILKAAKAQHDILEEYYVPNMDFEAVGKVQDAVIEKIEKNS